MITETRKGYQITKRGHRCLSETSTATYSPVGPRARAKATIIGIKSSQYQPIPHSETQSPLRKPNATSAEGRARSPIIRNTPTVDSSVACNGAVMNDAAAICSITAFQTAGE